MNKYFYFLQDNFGDKFETIIKDKAVREEIMDSFHNLTPKIMDEIEKKYLVEQELLGNTISDKQLPKAMSYTNFRKQVGILSSYNYNLITCRQIFPKSNATLKGQN